MKVNFTCLYSCKVSPYPPLCAIAWASVSTRRSQRLVSPLLLAHKPSGVARSAIAHAYIHAPHPHHARAQRSCVASIQRSRRAVKTRYSWPICHVCTVQFIKFSGDWNFLEHMIGGLYRKNRKSTAKAFQCE